ncbi:MAG: T9SS type A sorting domain-containing protein [Bacteroidota bacterium]
MSIRVTSAAVDSNGQNVGTYGPYINTTDGYGDCEVRFQVGDQCFDANADFPFSNSGPYLIEFVQGAFDLSGNFVTQSGSGTIAEFTYATGCQDGFWDQNAQQDTLAMADGYFVYQAANGSTPARVHHLPTTYPKLFNQAFGTKASISDLLGDDWVLPYDTPTLCALLASNGATDTCAQSIYFISTGRGYPFGGRYTFAGDVVNPVGFNWDFKFPLHSSVPTPTTSPVLAFQPGKALEIEQRLRAEDVTFTEGGPFANQGWNGIYFRTGSSGTIEASTIEETTGIALRVRKATVDLFDSQILNAGSRGIYASGAGTVVNFKESTSPPLGADTKIDNSGTLGIHAASGVEVYLGEAEITRSGDAGLLAYKSDIYLADSEITGSGEYGAEGTLASNIRFGLPGQFVSGENNVLEDNADGTLKARNGGYLDAGFLAGQYFQNSFLRTGSQLHAFADGGDIIAECNYWGVSSGPSLTYITTTNGGTFDGTPFLTSAGQTGCAPLNEVTGDAPTGYLAAARTGGSPSTVDPDTPTFAPSGPPEGMDARRWYARQQSAGETLGLLIAAVNEAETERDAELAYLAIAGGVRSGSAAGLDVFLSAQSQRAEHRPYALTALAELRLAEGRSDDARSVATSIAEEYARSERSDHVELAGHAYATLAFLAIDAGDVEAAEAALAGVRTVWPEGEVTELVAEAVDTDLRAYRDEAGGLRKEGSETVPVISARAPVEAFVLGAAYPNPSSGGATVPLVLRDEAEVRVVVYDLLGREVARLAEGRLSAGGHLLALDASALAAGTYVVRASVDGVASTQRLTVAR